MAADFKQIRAAIKKVIDDNADTVQETWNYERSTFGGYPAVIIVPSDNEADYGSTSKDRIVFVFQLKAYYIIPKEGEHAAAEAALEEVVDELLTLFRDKDVLGTACDWVEPAPSVWMYESRGEAVYRVAEITLRCVKYVG